MTVDRDSDVEKKAIVFQTLTRIHLMAVLWYWVRGYFIYYLKTTQDASGSRWFRRLQSSGRLSRLELDEPLYIYFYQANDLVYEVAESIYDTLYRDHWLVRHTVRLYGSEDVHLAFKRALITELYRYSYQRVLRHRIYKALPGHSHLVMVPHDTLHIHVPSGYELHLTSQEAAGTIVSHAVSIAIWSRLTGSGAVLKARIRAALVAARAMLGALSASARPLPRAGYPQAYDYAVTMASPLRDFADRIRGVDFLLDGERIRTDNTLFVPLTRMAAQNRNRALDNSLNLSSPRHLLSWKLLTRFLSSELAALVGVVSSPTWLAEATAYMDREYWTWSSFCDTYRVRNFISSSNLGFRHIGRNIVLNHNGTRTWYYAYSQNIEHPSGRTGRLRECAWGFLKYDMCVAWNQHLIDIFKDHKQDIGEYVAVGCLWSEHVRLIREGVIHSDFRERLADAGYVPGQPLVSVFDSTYANDSPTDYRDGVAFLEGIEGLLEEYPDIFVVLKEKKPRWLLSRNARSPDMSTYGIEEALRRLDLHPRCHTPGHTTSAAEVTAVSDLVISFPFTSTSVEALGAGVKALFYDPHGKLTDSFYDQAPELVAHGYPQLRETVGELLYHTSAEEYATYLEAHVKGVVDPYLDGMALSRFRSLLTGENELSYHRDPGAADHGPVPATEAIRATPMGGND